MVLDSLGSCGSEMNEQHADDAKLASAIVQVSRTNFTGFF
jgi:hypothetical protein